MIPDPIRAVFLDIDGTLNVRDPDSGFTLLTRETGYPIHCIEQVRNWICDLHDRGVRLVWNSTWNDQSEDYADWFDLPRGLEWIRHRENRASFGHSLKVRGAIDYLSRHPEIEHAAVLDDVIGTLDRELDDVVSGRLLLPEVDDLRGVTRGVIEDVEQFLFGSRSGLFTK